MPFADVNGQHLYFEDSGGDGAAVIFSHGFLMDHEMFQNQVAACSGEFRCVTWDERGFGQTEANGPFTYWDSADDALALLAALGAEQAFFVGMSQGGFLSLRAALKAPDRVLGLGLIDTQSGPEPADALPLYEAMNEDWVTNGPSDELTAGVASIIMSPGYDHSPWVAKWQARPRESMREPFATLAGRDDISDRLPEITAPAIVFHGEADAAIPMERAEQLLAELPNCEELVRIPGAGHASNLSHPDAVNGPLLAFLRRHRGEPSERSAMAEIDLTEPSDREILTWELFGTATRELATEIARDGFRPDIVLAIARGGLTVAGALAYALAVKNCFAMNVEFYTSVDERLDVPVVLPPMLDLLDIRGMRVLIADDVADTGKTLELVRKEISEHVAEARCAVLYHKPRSIITPEYVWAHTERWINFPWSSQSPVVESINTDA